MFSRRQLLTTSAGLLLLLLAVGGWLVPTGDAAASPAAISKSQVLNDLAHRVIAPAYAELDARCRTLAEAAEQLQEHPGPEALERVRQSWIDAALWAWRLEPFQLGPVVEDGLASAFYFQRIRPASVERAVNAAEPLSASGVEELGAAAKGLWAAEYLLFAPGADPVVDHESGAGGERRRQYLQLITRELAEGAARLARAWREPLSPAAARFVAGGQASFNALINRLASSLTSLNELHLLPLVGDAAKGPALGEASGTTVRLLLASLQGLRSVYTGGEGEGLDDHLRGIGSPVAERMDRQFDEALAAVALLQECPGEAGPAFVEKARTAYGGCRALETLVKVDLTSALGVTLTFSRIDSD